MERRATGPGQLSLSPVRHHCSSLDCSKGNWSIACDLTMTPQTVNFEKQSLRLFAGWMNKNPINRGNFNEDSTIQTRQITAKQNAEDPRNMGESDRQNEHRAPYKPQPQAARWRTTTREQKGWAHTHWGHCLAWRDLLCPQTYFRSGLPQRLPTVSTVAPTLKVLYSTH